MTGKSVIKINEKYKKFVIMWQSWLQAKTGKYISQGTAVALACHYLLQLLDKLPLESHKRGFNDLSKFLEILADKIIKDAKEVAEGELEEFDLEGLFAEIE